MSIGFISPEIKASLLSPLDYFTGTYNAAIYNFASSIDFASLEERTNEVAISLLDQTHKEPAFDSMAGHFFSHLAVGIILMIPMINFIFFACLAYDDPEEIILKEENVPDIIIKTPEEPAFEPIIKPLGLPSRLSELVESDNTPKLKPEPEIQIELPSSPLKMKKRANSRALQRAIAIEENQIKSDFQAMLKPSLDAKRANSVSIGEFNEIEDRFARRFFRLFPNETRVAEFASLRKKLGDTDCFTPLSEDKKFIEPLFLNSPGYTPEVRFIDAEQNLNALYKHLENSFRDLDGEFYLEGNFKNDMQKSKSDIPYIHLIEIMFRASSEEFIAELEKTNFVKLSPLEGERTPIRVDALDYKPVAVGSIRSRVLNYRRSVSQNQMPISIRKASL